MMPILMILSLNGLSVRIGTWSLKFRLQQTANVAVKLPGALRTAIGAQKEKKNDHTKK